jgi:opacity protein-like surface antigen
MKRTLAGSILVVLLTHSAFAQSNDNAKAEFFGGYSFGSTGVSFGTTGAGAQVYRERANQHGFNASGVFNFNRYVGIKGDVSGTFRSGRHTFTVPTGIQSTPTVPVSFEAKTSLYNFLAGIQIKDNARDKRLAPFAHALVGAAHRSNKIKGGPFACILIIPCPGDTSETALSFAFGGGLDIKLNRRVALRLIQADYNPIKFNTRTDHNFRFSTGLVFH